MENYPNGEMTKSQFIKRCISQYNSSEEQADNLFNVFDGDNSETIDFAEFIMASHATTLRYVIIILYQTDCFSHGPCLWLGCAKTTQ